MKKVNLSISEEINNNLESIIRQRYKDVSAWIESKEFEMLNSEEQDLYYKNIAFTHFANILCFGFGQNYLLRYKAMKKIIPYLNKSDIIEIISSCGLLNEKS